ncbi:glutamine synthetase [Candidatus Roizmanbacteria bacterium RIFCSPHIGHO2_12_FULL_41_11]|uniref:Glutamine synthetase n=2 Tax=Candidatus Roizmaniibacteriota TaxID=1752723 RepID=A0A1F7JR66_9BACT|nr:MAG: glutamine synthetase [Candidatus Roizmanbacteria bacterium RIFCSPHIGHO2_12_FULL_41_11]OGK58104.1 MAG: glutamine synthetase [Candidatus Roizmanbacteria bacterium RIFCSPLOWO2_02_FULL_41_9]
MEEKPLKTFLEIPYDELQTMNIEAKKRREAKTPEDDLQQYYLIYLKKEKRLKAVTIGFSDLEGRFHMLDYDKNFFLHSYDNLTFDGSSIRGFSRQAESDLRLRVDWGAFWWMPSDVFGPGKVLMMGKIIDQDGSPYIMDTRGLLASYLQQLWKKRQYTVKAANEIEGFVVCGKDAETNYDEKQGFELVSVSGYYHSLPNDTLRNFIDRSAEAQRAMGFANEKDHPEVAPSQFELNYSYSDALNAADQIQIYKLVCRQVAHNMGMTATFLPKPIMGINGSGMHTNLSISAKGRNLFHDKKGRGGLSTIAWDFIYRILASASDMSLILNSSVNAYRRLDPHFEAPNEIKVSEIDRGAMIRIPLHNERSARIEVRSVGPDANPYLAMYALIKTGLEGLQEKKTENKRPRVRFLPGNIQTAITLFRQSDFMTQLLGVELKKHYLDLKQTVANRSASDLGTKVKNSEVIYHHEVYNQMLWNEF